MGAKAIQMHLDLILNGIQHYGYAALFFFLWLGIFGMPIPDEVIVMCGGFVTSLGILKPIPSFLLTYGGVVSGLSIGYTVGRIIGSQAIERLMRKKKMGTYIEKADALIARYGTFSLVISYFFPVVRHVVPYIVGINKMPFSKYAAFSYSTGFVWTLILFMVGRYFGKSIETISKYITQYGWISLILFSLLVSLVIVVKKVGKKGESIV
jgi:membrane-associated protein